MSPVNPNQRRGRAHPSPAEVVDWLFRRLPIEGNSAVYGQLVTASFSQDEVWCPPPPPHMSHMSHDQQMVAECGFE